jgi:hypothetical protein
MIEWFSMSFLSLERVTMDMPGHVLDQIVQGEKVHPIETFASLRQRLGSGRRCYAFFHPSLPKVPLAFVHVALLNEIADRMDVITGDEIVEMDDESEATTAIFYSISSTQPGISGVDLGNFLIKRVARELQVFFCFCFFYICFFFLSFRTDDELVFSFLHFIFYLLFFIFFFLSFFFLSFLFVL